MTWIKSQTQHVDDIDMLSRRVEKNGSYSTGHRVQDVIPQENRLTQKLTYA